MQCCISVPLSITFKKLQEIICLCQSLEYDTIHLLYEGKHCQNQQLLENCVNETNKDIKFITFKQLHTLETVKTIIEINEPFPNVSLIRSVRNNIQLIRYIISNPLVYYLQLFKSNTLTNVNEIKPDIVKTYASFQKESDSLLKCFYPNTPIEYIPYIKTSTQNKKNNDTKLIHKGLSVFISGSATSLTNNWFVSTLAVLEYTKLHPEHIDTIIFYNIDKTAQISVHRLLSYVWNQTVETIKHKIKYYSQSSITYITTKLPQFPNKVLLNHSKWYGEDFDIQQANTYNIPVIHNCESMKDISYYYPNHSIDVIHQHLSQIHTQFQTPFIQSWKPIFNTFKYTLHPKHKPKYGYSIQLQNELEYRELGILKGDHSYNPENIDVKPHYTHYFVHPFAGFIKKDRSNFTNLWMGNHIMTHYWNLKDSGYPVGLSDTFVKGSVNILPINYYLCNKNPLFWQTLAYHKDTTFILILAELSDRTQLPDLSNVTYARQNPSIIEKTPCYIPLFDLTYSQSKPSRNSLQTIGYFGTKENCNEYIQCDEFRRYCEYEGFTLKLCYEPSQWTSQIHQCDVIIAIRPDWNKTYDDKPSSKLINAIRNGIPFIGGKESAYSYEADKIQAKTSVQLVSNKLELIYAIRVLKKNYKNVLDDVKRIQSFYTNTSLAKQVASQIGLRNTMIPRILHNTYSNLDNLLDPVRNNMELNQAKCREHNWEFKFYNADDRDSIIKTHFSPNIYKAYTSINPEYGPAQADFFRYCLMYLYGGMYIDIKSEFNPNILNVLNTDKYDIFLSHWSEKCKNVGENYVKYGSQGEICNWILISKPKQAFWLDLLQHIASLISIWDNTKWTGKSAVLRLTGPIMFTNFYIHYSDKQRIFVYPRSSNKVYTCFDSVNPYCYKIRTANMNQNYFKNHYSKLTSPLVISPGVYNKRLTYSKHMIVFSQSNERLALWKEQNRLWSIQKMEAFNAITNFEQLKQDSLQKGLMKYNNFFYKLCETYPGKLGCQLSHYYLTENFYTQSNKDWCVIMEDDCIFEPSDTFPTFDDLIKHAIQLANKHQSELVKLYADPIQNPIAPAIDLPKNKIEENYYRLQDNVSRACYIISKRAAKEILNRKPFYESGDIMLNHFQYIHPNYLTYYKNNNIKLKGAVSQFDTNSEFKSIIWNSKTNH